MKGRLYRFTPAGGKPNHYTHDHSSAVRAINNVLADRALRNMAVGGNIGFHCGQWERVA